MILDQSKVSRPLVQSNLDQSRPLDPWSGPFDALTSMGGTYFDFAGFASAILKWSNGGDVKN